MPAFDEDGPKKIPTHAIGQDLGPLSLEELSGRIAMLKDEITRIEAAMSAKRASADVADAFFKT